MLNRKGFTLIEVVISFTFVVIILTSMFAIIINYQNETEEEKIKSNLLTYKNTVLEAVYDDVIGENMKMMSSCGEQCVQIHTKTDIYKLEVINENGEKFLNYRDTKYLLPDSKIGLSTINNFEYRFDTANLVYEVNIPIIHAELDNDDNLENYIKIVVSGKEFNK